LVLYEISLVKKRLDEIKIYKKLSCELVKELDLSMFFEEKTLAEILSIKKYLSEKKLSGQEDYIDRWIKMVATNRLTGHSSGFFSVYTLPPNQAISASKQKELNEKHNRTPTYRDTKTIIIKKSLTLLKTITNQQKLLLNNINNDAVFLNKNACETSEIRDNHVNLIVTSPPFLDVIDYAKDNWLRCWFNEINIAEISKNISCFKKIEDWCDFIAKCFSEFYRITEPQGYVAFEVGEVKNGKIKLEEYVVPIGLNIGFQCIAIIINSQKFTKTANIWGVKNNNKGTNSNRIVLFQKI
jgi:hypothetical protein